MKKIILMIIVGLHATPFSTYLENAYPSLFESHRLLQFLLSSLKIMEKDKNIDGIISQTQLLQKNLLTLYPERSEEFNNFFTSLYQEALANNILHEIRENNHLTKIDQEELQLLKGEKRELIQRSQDLEKQGLPLLFRHTVEQKRTERLSRQANKLLKEHLKPAVVGTYYALIESKKAFVCYKCKQSIQENTGLHTCKTTTCLPEVFSCTDCYRSHSSLSTAFKCPTCDQPCVDNCLYPIAQNYRTETATQTDCISEML